MRVVALAQQSIARDHELGRIDDDDEVARIHMIGIGWLRLAEEGGGNLRCEATERLAFSVNHVPVALNLSSARRPRLHVHINLLDKL